MSARFKTSVAIVGSPAAATETIIAQLTVADSIAVATGVLVEGYAAFVIGTSGTAVRMRVRQTNVSGTVVADSDAVTGGIAAGNKVTMSVNGIDTAPTLPGQVYCLTLTVTAGAAASTVAFVALNIQVV
jgi:hypothetical protein